MLIAGKADLVARNRNGENTMFDVKPGQPRKSDVIQVMLYMMCLPHANERFNGEGLQRLRGLQGR